MKPTQEQVIAWAREAGLQCAKNYDYRGLYEAMPLLEQQDFDKVLLALTLAYEAGQESMKWDGIHSCHPDCQRPACVHTRKTYQEGYEAGRKDEREKVAQWMIQRSYATGHGDTTEDLLAELEWQIAENWNRAMINGVETEREACAKVCDAKVDAEYATGKVDHNEMGWTQACAIAIRARREQ